MSYVIKKKVAVEEEYTTVDVDTATDDIEARLNISNTINEVNDATTTIENLSELENETIQKLEEAEEKIQNGEVDSCDVVDMECFKQKMELIMGVKLSGPTIALEDARSNPKEQFILCTEGIKGALKSIWEFIKKIFKWIGDKIKQFVSWIKSFFSEEERALRKLEKMADQLDAEVKSGGFDNIFNNIKETEIVDAEIIENIKDEPLSPAMNAIAAITAETLAHLSSVDEEIKKSDAETKKKIDDDWAKIHALQKQLDEQLNTEAIKSNGNGVSNAIANIVVSDDVVKIQSNIYTNIKKYMDIRREYLFDMAKYDENLNKDLEKKHANKDDDLGYIVHEYILNTIDSTNKYIKRLEKEIFVNKKSDIKIDGIKLKGSSDFKNVFLKSINFSGMEYDKYVTGNIEYNFDILEISEVKETHAGKEVTRLIYDIRSESISEKFDASNVKTKIFNTLKAIKEDKQKEEALVGTLQGLNDLLLQHEKKYIDPLQNLINKVYDNLSTEKSKSLYNKLVKFRADRLKMDSLIMSSAMKSFSVVKRERKNMFVLIDRYLKVLNKTVTGMSY